MEEYYEQQHLQQQEQFDNGLDMDNEYDKFYDSENINRRFSQDYLEYCFQSNILTETQSYHNNDEDHLPLIIEAIDYYNDNRNNYIEEQYDEQDNYIGVSLNVDVGDNLITIGDVNELNESFYKDNDFVRHLWTNIKQ